MGPGHGRRRAFGMPDRGHGRDTGVADTDRAVMTRDPATGPPAHDPATGPPARDAHPHRRIRRRTIRHATPIRDAVSGDGRYGTRRSFPMPYPATDDTAHDNHPRRSDRRPALRHAMIISYPKYARNMPGICPDMPGICPDMLDDVSLPEPSGSRIMGCERPNAGPQLRRWQVCRSAQL